MEVGFLRAPSFSAPRVTDVISDIKTSHWRQEHGTAKGVQRLHHQLRLPCALFCIAQLVKNPPAMQQAPVRFLGWEDPLEKERATHSSILAWRIPCTTVHGVAKESDTTEQTFTSPSDILGLLSWCNGKESTGQCHFQWQLSGEVFCSVFLSMPDMGMGLTGGASGKEPACQCRRLQRCRFDPCMGKIPWRRKWQPTPVFLPGKFHGQGCLVDYSP